MLGVKTRTKGLAVLVDEDTADLLRDTALYINKAGYVVFLSKGRQLIYLHRHVLGMKGVMVYFKDGNRLNCCRSNLGVSPQKKGRPRKPPPPEPTTAAQP